MRGGKGLPTLSHGEAQGPGRLAAGHAAAPSVLNVYSGEKAEGGAAGAGEAERGSNERWGGRGGGQCSRELAIVNASQASAFVTPPPHATPLESPPSLSRRHARVSLPSLQTHLSPTIPPARILSWNRTRRSFAKEATSHLLQPHGPVVKAVIRVSAAW